MRKSVEQLLVIPSLLGALLLASCGDNDPSSPVVVQTSGTTTLASTYTGEGVLAFSFERGEVIISDSANAGDLFTLAMIREGGEVFGAFMGAPGDSSFGLVARLDTYDEALSAFNALEDPGDLDFEFIGIPALPNQIWLVETHDGKWAKMLIIDAHGVEGERGEAFGVITFHWVYRPDGARVFEPT